MECLQGASWSPPVTPDEICRRFLASELRIPDEVLAAVEDDLHDGILDGDLPLIGHPNCQVHNPVTRLTHLLWTTWLCYPGAHNVILKAAAWGFVSPNMRAFIADLWSESGDPTLEAIASVQVMAQSSPHTPSPIQKPRR
jgi:hypothetical protein